MKVFVALVLVFASVSARGSGPYLPSGWKPSGPAFYLPAEIAKPEPNPVQEAQFQETEASGSDALREYGPPKLEVISLNVNQGLPEVATAQTFAEARNAAAEETENVEVNTEQVAAIVEEVASSTESQAVEEQAVEEQAIKEQAVEEQAAELSEAVPTASEVEATSEAVSEQLNEETVSTIVAVEEIAVPTARVAEEIVVPTAGAELVVTLAQEEGPASEAVVPQGVNNIAEAIINLEKEVKAAEVVAELSSTQEASGSLEQAPEGFLEYGPPGFTEYGPPKQESLARVALESGPAVLENNEVRRRRFSPKFRSSKRH